MCADSTTPSYLAFPGRLAQGMREKRDLRCYFYHPHCQLLRCRLGWEDCCWCWLLLDLLAISTRLSRVLCCRLGLTFAKKKIQAWKEVALHLRFPPSWLAVLERHRRSTCCCCGTPLPHYIACWRESVYKCATRRVPATLP